MHSDHSSYGDIDGHTTTGDALTMIDRQRGDGRSQVSHLECGHCNETHDAHCLQNVCRRCGGPLLTRYRSDADLPSLGEILARPPGQFRFHERLPLAAGARTPTLGEGGTPLIRAAGLGRTVWVKDESQNPTGSFKARGMAVAVGRNYELGARRFCLPSNGNAGGAAAAYGAIYAASIEVVVPDNTPHPLVEEIGAYGGKAIRVEGSIADAAHLSRERAAEPDWFSLATLGEPYRVEGKKIMAYEIFWDLGALPDVIIYPTGGGTGLVGMVKGFDEMEALGWIGSERPRMVAAQVAGCAPIVRAFHAGADFAEAWTDPEESAAFGIRVPSALGDRLMLDGLRRTNGTAVAVDELEMIHAARRMARKAGVWGSPEGGACLAAYDSLRATNWLSEGDSVVLFNTGAAAKYASIS